MANDSAGNRPRLRDECSCGGRSVVANEYDQHVLAGGREVSPGLVAVPDGAPTFAPYVACYYAYIEAKDDDEAFSRMVRLRDVFSLAGQNTEHGLAHIHDADGC